VQSLACLDEADHTVGFLLQLSSFSKEWQFHLPKLLRDVQASRRKPQHRQKECVVLVLSVQLFIILLCAGKPVLPVPDLHVSASQQEDAPSLPPGKQTGLFFNFIF